jgi:hypothetical protein
MKFHFSIKMSKLFEYPEIEKTDYRIENFLLHEKVSEVVNSLRILAVSKKNVQEYLGGFDLIYFNFEKDFFKEWVDKLRIVSESVLPKKIYSELKIKLDFFQTFSEVFFLFVFFIFEFGSCSKKRLDTTILEISKECGEIIDMLYSYYKENNGPIQISLYVQNKIISIINQGYPNIDTNENMDQLNISALENYRKLNLKNFYKIINNEFFRNMFEKENSSYMLCIIC